MFSQLENENGELSKAFILGICRVHARRNFCELLNYSTHKDVVPFTEMIANKWEQDITDSRYFVEAISKNISIYNDIVKDCNKDSSLEICKLKDEKVKPFFTKVQASLKPLKGAEQTVKSKLNHRENALTGFIRLWFTLLITKKV